MAKQRARGVFNRFRPSLLVVSGDRHLPFEVPMVMEARRRKVPVLMPPGAYSDVPSIFVPRIGRPAYSVKAGGLVGYLNKWVAHRYPGQVGVDERADPTLFYPAATTLALVANGLLPNRPWVLGASGVDRVCVAGNEARDRYSRDGLPPDRIRVTGHPTLDALYDTNQNKTRLKMDIENDLKLPRGRPLWVFAPPQLGEHRQTSWPEHWRFMDFAWERLSRSGANVVCSLHPKSNVEDYRLLERKFGIPIIDRPLRELLPIADRYVSTFSTTIEWAILCGIPCDVVDFWQLGTSEFYRRYALRVARTESEFDQLIASPSDSFPDPVVITEIARFDGGSTGRVVSEIVDMCPY